MATNDIILFHYPYSPLARRVIWYLELRGIPYTQCIQPPTWPREDLLALGVNYRRIPVMAIGRDVYCDTKLMLRKLEAMFPASENERRDNDHIAVERLLEKWTCESDMFGQAAALIPLHFPAMNDPKFTKDREDFSGAPWSKERLTRARPEATANIRNSFDLLETAFFADGRDWILKTNKPTLADVHAVWPFHWLNDMQGALNPDVISEKQFPKVFAWIARFNAALKAAKAKNGKPPTISGANAVERVLAASFHEEPAVSASDPLALQTGDLVEVYPTDTGMSHRQRGRLVGLQYDEVTVEAISKSGKQLHVHMPRTKYRVLKGKQAKI